MTPAVQLWITALGAALVHFVWEAGVIAVVVLLSQARWDQGGKASARTRYARNCVALFSLPVVFVATLLWEYAGGAAGWTAIALPASIWMPRAELLPYVAGVWLLGVLVMAGRSFGGWVWLWRARREADSRVPKAWRRVLERVRERVGMAGEVGLGVSARVVGPCVAGWWRPLILLPVSALAGLDPAQLEALLAHELAHIVRHDYVVNLAQRALEVVFFYHPAVWWLSAQVTQEREHCCDDMAIDACGDALVYARALVDSAAAAAPRRELACAASGGELRPRVLRILGLPARPAPARFWAAGTLTLALLGAGVWLRAPRPQAVPSGPAALAAPAATVAPAALPALAPAVAHLAVPPRPLAAALAMALPALPRPAVAPAVMPAAPSRERQFVAFSFTAVESCTPRWQWVGTRSPDGRVWISLEPVVSCTPVLEPTEVWVSSL